MNKPVKTVKEFLSGINQLEGGLFVYRGMADVSWKVESSAYRRIHWKSKVPPTPLVLENYTKQLLEGARQRGFQKRHGKTYSDLELLAELQHLGGATCLIDFTTNALIALWFACQAGGAKTAGKVCAMATDDPERFSIVTSQHIDNKIDFFLDKEIFWKWAPSHLSDRIVAQQSIFLFGTGMIEEMYYTYIKIDEDAKGSILEEIDNRFGITEWYLFSDFSGFALSNAHDKPYHEYTGEDFYSLGSTTQQKEEYERAIQFFDLAISADNKNARAFGRRGQCKAALKDYINAIADFDRVLELDMKYALATYNNRAFSKEKIGDFSGAMLDYKKALETDPESSATYYNRGLFKARSNDYQGAIEDFDQALEINPEYSRAEIAREKAKRYLGDDLNLDDSI